MYRSLDKPFKIIAAINKHRVIGSQGTIPWKCSEDMAYFRELTLRTEGQSCRNAVIMGARTWESLTGPLKNRMNVIISGKGVSVPKGKTPIDQYISSNVRVFPSLGAAHMWLKDQADIDQQFIIGGGQLYNEAISANWCHELHLAEIDNDAPGDVYFPEIPSHYQLTTCTDLGAEARVKVYRNLYTRHLEEQYLQHMNRLVHCTPQRKGRNGIVYSGFQWQFKMDLSDGIPLFSTRRAFWKGICKELLFFIRGGTNSQHLAREGVKIWEGNTTREFLDARGLNYEVGDMGPMYGWIWRNYGARYQGMNYNYRGEGTDQLRYVIDKLLHDPYDRRILMTSYDPSKVKESVLAPCHSIVNQFNVRTELDGTYLDMITYQRSADMFLGVYFNIPSDALLQSIIAKAVNMKPGKLYIEFGDTHVYAEHVEPLKEQLLRTPNEVFPQLQITDPPKSQATDDVLRWIESLTYEDFKIINYVPAEHIKADMVA